MSQEVEIKNFLGLLNTSNEFKNRIRSVETRKIPQSGYGSIMVKATITLTNGRVVHTIAKLLPTDPLVRKAFHIEITYKNEVAFYNTILPTLIHFQKEQGGFPLLDMFAKCYCSRLSLVKEDEVDDDGVLVLEDLSAAGFKNGHRSIGFDLEGAKRILKDLARFQGTAIALKLKKIELFEKNIKTFCTNFQFLDEVVYTDMLKDVIKENEACAGLADSIGKWPCEVPVPREPYATIAHFDLWVNNTMQKFVDGKILSNIFIDFQMFAYRSCASDVFFFLWTSCEKDVLENHLDDLLKYYHDNLIETIKRFNCDLSQFSYDKFLDDIKYESTYEFGHTLTFIVIVKDKPLLDEDTLKNNISREEIIAKLPRRVKEFLYFFVQECDKRGWLH